MAWRSYVALALLATFAPFLYDTFRSLRLLVVNKPTNLPSVNNLGSSNIVFENHLRNCEDVVLDTSEGFALISCSPGRDKYNTVMGNFVDGSEHGSVYLYRYGEAPDDLPKRLPLDGFDSPFHPIGLSYHPESKTVAVTNHGGHAATIELFDFADGRLKHRRSLSDEDNLRTPNSIAFINSTHIYVTNTHILRVRSKPVTFFDRLYLLLSKLELRLGAPTGSLSLVDISTGETSKVLGLGFANGVEFLDNGRQLAVASTIKASVYLYDISADHLSPMYLQRINTPYFPDNLGADSRGHLFIAGHPVPAALSVMVYENWRCHVDPELRSGCYHAPSHVQEWDPKSSTLKDVYVGDAYPSSAGVAYDADRNVIIMVGLYADGLLVGRK